MKRLSLLLCVVLLSACSIKYKWTKTERGLVAAFLVAQTVDTYTTTRAIDLGGHEKYALFGHDRPSDKTFIAWKMGQSVLVLGAAHAANIISPTWRKAILVGATGVVGYYGAYHNPKQIRKMKARHEFWKAFHYRGDVIYLGPW